MVFHLTNTSLKLETVVDFEDIKKLINVSKNIF